MIKKSWIEHVKQALDSERQEEWTRQPVIQGYSLELFKTPEIVEQLKNAPQFPLKQLQECGYAMTHLEFCETRSSGAIGKSVLVLERPEGREAEGANFRARDLIYLFDHKSRLLSRGTLTSVRERELSLLLDDVEPDDVTGPFIVTKAGSDATYRYNSQVLKALEANTCMGELGEFFIQTFFQSDVSSTATYKQLDTDLALPEYRQKLNQQQLRAAQKIQNLDSKQFLVIHGPPGSGKTTTLLAGIKCYLKAHPDARVLVTGPSNCAVDNLLEGLDGLHCCIVRIGSVARASSNVQGMLLDNVVRSLNADELREALDDTKKCKAQLDKARKKMYRDGQRREFIQARQELRDATKSLQHAEKSCVESTLQKAKIVGCTLSGCSHFNTLKAAEYSHGFDLVVIDEAAQALDVQLISALQLVKKAVVMAGDPMQLAPTVCSETAQQCSDYSQPLLYRLCQAHRKETESQNYTFLDIQYRFDALINKFPSENIYGGRLKADIEQAEHLGEWESSVLFMDTTGYSYQEEKPNSQSDKILEQLSIRNPDEANLVLQLVKKLVREYEIVEQEIGIITPYAAQVSLLISKLRGEENFQNVEISTVDGFQGREKRIIIISMVRSNDSGEVGFLSDKKRLNVSITRAKQLLVIVGDADTLNDDEFLKQYVDFLYDNAEMLSVDDYLG